MGICNLGTRARELGVEGARGRVERCFSFSFHTKPRKSHPLSPQSHQLQFASPESVHARLTPCLATPDHRYRNGQHMMDRQSAGGWSSACVSTSTAALSMAAPPRAKRLKGNCSLAASGRRCNMASTFAQINDHAVDPTSIAARHHIACWSLQDHMHRGVKLASRVTRRAHRLARLAGSSPKGKKVALCLRE